MEERYGEILIYQSMKANVSEHIFEESELDEESCSEFPNNCL